MPLSLGWQGAHLGGHRHGRGDDGEQDDLCQGHVSFCFFSFNNLNFNNVCV